MRIRYIEVGNIFQIFYSLSVFKSLAYKGFHKIHSKSIILKKKYSTNCTEITRMIFTLYINNLNILKKNIHKYKMYVISIEH